MSDEEKIQIAALGLLGILGRKPKRRPKSPRPQRSPSPQRSPRPSGSGGEKKKADTGFGSNDDSGSKRKEEEEWRRAEGEVLTRTPNVETDKEQDVAELLEAYQEAFSQYDKDNSGFIDLSELAEGYRLAGLNLQEALKAMREHDVDKNGNLSFVEFSTWGLDTDAIKDWGDNFVRARKAIISDLLERSKASLDEGANILKTIRVLTKKISDATIRFNENFIENEIKNETLKSLHTRLKDDGLQIVQFYSELGEQVGIVEEKRELVAGGNRTKETIQELEQQYIRLQELVASAKAAKDNLKTVYREYRGEEDRAINSYNEEVRSYNAKAKKANNDAAEVVEPTEPIVAPTGKTGAKVREAKKDGLYYDNMVTEYLKDNNLMTDDTEYAQLTGENKDDWKEAVKHFNQTPRKNCLKYLYRGFLNAATRRDKGTDTYGKDQLTTVFAGDQETAEDKFTTLVEPFLAESTYKGEDITKVPSGGNLAPLLDSLIGAWGEDVYKDQTDKKIEHKDPEVPTKVGRKIARGGDSSVGSGSEEDAMIDAAIGSASSSDEDDAGGSEEDAMVDAAIGSASSSDEDDAGGNRSVSGSDDDSGSDEEEDDDGGVGGKIPVQRSSSDDSSDGGDGWTVEKEAMARGLLRPMQMYMISIGQEEPIWVDSIKEALSSRTYIPDIRRFVYKVKPGQIFEYNGKNYVKIKNSDNLKDKDTKYQIVDGKMQTEIEDLIPGEKRRKLLADVQAKANADDTSKSMTEFAPRLRF